MYKDLEDSISASRLSAYDRGNGDVETLASYHWNIALCESFYPPLQTLEVGLRNALNKAGNKAFRDPMWFKRPFMGEELLEDVSEAEKKLRENGKDQDDPGRIIAELKFGFWTRLFGRKYDGVLWANYQFITTAFPGLSRRERLRTKLAGRFDRIRDFRNRVFHHEPILNYDFPRHHGDIKEAMNWIHPILVKSNSLVDRFLFVSAQEYFDQIHASVAACCLPPSNEDS